MGLIILACSKQNYVLFTDFGKKINISVDLISSTNRAFKAQNNVNKICKTERILLTKSYLDTS